MYCPECGIEERNANQFCRACGADLRLVRSAISTPDSVTASAVSAREDIGRAVAARIRETHDAYELKKVAEDVLPEIEKFLESPEERRLRRMRVGTIIASVGLGTSLSMALVAIFTGKEEFLMLFGFGFIALMIGLGFFFNGFFLTLPKKGLPDRSDDAKSQRELDAAGTGDLKLPQQPASLFSSVTEHTTHQLQKKDAK